MPQMKSYYIHTPKKSYPYTLTHNNLFTLVQQKRLWMSKPTVQTLYVSIYSRQSVSNSSKVATHWLIEFFHMYPHLAFSTTQRISFPNTSIDACSPATGSLGLEMAECVLE